MMYAPFPTLTAADQAGQFVAERIAAGSDYLKIISGTGGLWPSLDPETIQALVIAAHTRGFVVVAHVSSTAGVEEVVSAGVDVVAHVPANAELDKALVERMAEAGIVVGPTLATIENTLGEPGGAAVAGDPRLAEALGDAWARRLTSDASGWQGRKCRPTRGPRTTCDDWPMRGSLCWRARMLRTRGPCSEQACTESSLTLSTPSSPRSWQPCANAGPTDPGKPLECGSRSCAPRSPVGSPSAATSSRRVHRNQVTPGFTDTTDRNGRDARIQALAQVPVATLAGLPRAPREGERCMTRHQVAEQAHRSAHATFVGALGSPSAELRREVAPGMLCMAGHGA